MCLATGCKVGKVIDFCCCWCQTSCKKRPTSGTLSEFGDIVRLFSVKLLRENRSGYGKWRGRIRIRITWLHLHTTQSVCGSLSWIRCLFDPWIRDPGWTTRIIFPRAYEQCFGLKYLISLMRIPDGKNSDPGSGDRGWKKLGSGIWDKHPGFATPYTALIMLIG